MVENKIFSEFFFKKPLISFTKFLVFEQLEILNIYENNIINVKVAKVLW
jgi:hypothetical protein